MTEEQVLRSLARGSSSKMLLFVLDGLGDIAGVEEVTPLEAASTPVMDRLAAEGSCGYFDPVSPGVTPGSGPGHLALFGYDPLSVMVGRGVLAALGIGFPLQRGDVAARFNFCTLGDDGAVLDRRAGRISTEENRRLVAKLRKAVGELDVPGVEIFVETVKEHRGLLVIRGSGLGAGVTDTDPQATGVPPKKALATDEASKRTAEIVNRVVEASVGALEGEKANGILLRGFDSLPEIDTLEERFGIRACCLATYPMYRGLARLAGMEILEVGDESQYKDSLASVWGEFDLFFVHVKATDKAGEDGSFERKVEAIEMADRILGELLELAPEVVAVAADHSTPVAFKSHSYHPVPVILWAPGRVLADDATRYSERQCASFGCLGRLRLLYLLPLMLGASGRLEKYGA